MKIYTRTGDQGETSLYRGGRVSKGSPRVEAYGTVDELNALLGVAVTRIDDREVGELIGRLQNELFILGADLATVDRRRESPKITPDHVAALEAWIDRYEQELQPLSQFILPGGTPGGALLHLARTVARRAERMTVRLAESEEINDEVIKYLNRLSDLLFVLARVVNRRAERDEPTVEY